VVAQRRAGEPRIGRRQGPGAHENVQNREVHRLLAPIDLGVQRAHPNEEEKADGEGDLRLPEELPPLAVESEDRASPPPKENGAEDCQGQETSQRGGAAVGNQMKLQEKRVEVGGAAQPQKPRDSGAPVLELREENPGERQSEETGRQTGQVE